jgi:hypothetical protein
MYPYRQLYMYKCNKSFKIYTQKHLLNWVKILWTEEKKLNQFLVFFVISLPIVNFLQCWEHLCRFLFCSSNIWRTWLDNTVNWCRCFYLETNKINFFFLFFLLNSCYRVMRAPQKLITDEFSKSRMKTDRYILVNWYHGGNLNDC